jgi:hypothetical protein
MSTCRTVYINSQDVEVALGLQPTHLFAQEVADFNSAAAVLDDAVDREVGIYQAHLISEALHSTFNISPPREHRNG